MINLIPNSAKKNITLEYWVRVVSAWAYLWAFAIVIAIAILVPTYVLINIKVSVYADSAQDAFKSVADYQEVSDSLNGATRQASLILNNRNTAPMFDYVKLFEGLQGDQIMLSEMSLMREQKGLGDVLLAGTAEDREALASFRDRLLAEPLISEVDLPISNLAKDRNIQFNITVTMDNSVSL